MTDTFAVINTHRHLVLIERELSPSTEWQPKVDGWLGLRVAAGQGYWLQNKNQSDAAGAAVHSLAAGGVLFVGGNFDGILRASQLEAIKIHYFVVLPRFLSGVLTIFQENTFADILKSSAGHFYEFAAEHTLGHRFAELVARPGGDNLSCRCTCLQLWSDAVAPLLPDTAVVPGQEEDLRIRFRQFVRQFTEAELISLSLSKLAELFKRSERQFSRLFSEEFGVSLRERKQELRLKRAQLLLGNREHKIIHVAHESGYRHVGLFNLTFKRRFGMTPSQWRRKKLFPGEPGAKTRRLVLR
jgi:AraC-like DNA-binding protein